MRSTSAISLALICLTASAQQTATKTEATHLPVSHVSLYKNGVGFFEHTGHITGNAAVTIDFTDAQLDDVLQTLTAIDLNGGRIAGAGYNSTMPLEQQLKNLGLGLAEQTDYASLFAALHGARVAVNGSGAPFTGRIVDIEVHSATTPPTGENPTTQRDTDFLTVASETGEIRIFEVKPNLSIRLLDTATQVDLNQYLHLLDATRSHGLRHLTLEDHGTGARELRLSYLSEVPIWKSTYRILFTDIEKISFNGAVPPVASTVPAQTATLQGWSVVDNTTGTDWINVKLSLIAGAPQSFIQPLSQPIYSRRPEIPIAQEAQLTPQTFESGLEPEGNATAPVMSLKAPPPPPSAVMASRRLSQSAGTGVAYGSSMGASAGGVMTMSSPSVSMSYQDAVAASTNIAASTAAFDDYFSYNLTEPVTIHKNESALVPILQVKIPADRVTLVSSNGNSTSQPLRALWITNSSNITLDRGSFSLVEDGNFGGEGLLDPIHPGEKRLLSYAADQAVHVSTEGNKSNTHATFLRGSKGVLNIHHTEFHEITYVLRNAAAEDRTVVLEEPVVNGFKLDSETPGNTDPKPVETTPTVYRFRVVVPAGQTIRLHSGATRSGFTTYYLTRSDENQFNLIVNQSDKNPALIAALQPILDARRKVADAQTAVDQTSKRLTDLRSDEDRQRANITALATADKASRDRFVHDLNTTEDTIAAAQKELATRTAALDTAKADLANRIQDFHINTSKDPKPDTEP